MTLFGSRKGSEERNLFVCCLFVGLFIFGLVWFWFSQRKILRHEKKTFFSLFQAFPPPLVSPPPLPPTTQNKNKKRLIKRAWKAFLCLFLFLLLFFPFATILSYLPLVLSYILHALFHLSLPSPSPSLSLTSSSHTHSPPPYLNAKQHRTGTFQ